ncbi:GNAT family N-acetyltransferase [Embleya sp. NPDC127516]|uniref:GNAT family N-acetyltransferase n=1 Tax=Embleya sp. NPDC127516 TaxID=3363990 RepID=UPI0037F4212B
MRDEAATRAYVEENIELARREPRTKYLLVIESAEDASVVGTIALVIESPGVGSVGFAVRRSAWGRGYAGAALEALLGYAFTTLGLHRVWAGHEPDNTASGRVLKRPGMYLEGTRRQDVFLRGAWRDTILYAALAPEWSPDTAR